jgi:hypothetical protein
MVTIRAETATVRPTLLQNHMSRLLKCAGIVTILAGVGVASVEVPAGPYPLAGTIIATVGYAAFFGNYLLLRNTTRGSGAATGLKMFLGLSSLALLFTGLLTVFGMKDLPIPNGYLFVDGGIFGVLLVAFHLYAKRPAQT